MHKKLPQNVAKKQGIIGPKKQLDILSLRHFLFKCFHKLFEVLQRERLKNKYFFVHFLFLYGFVNVLLLHFCLLGLILL